ncbi:MAG: GMC family oxidoreductase [Deltaproteobacteria bacterium]|nr:GMC family oxidoreductase [Deltaproteobacteria bacterium]MBW2361425.1 GMC family oxidoreductase [Deltaproteobacteria bacterium]
MRALTRLHTLDALDATVPYDVCIVGSGFAGTVLASELASAGVRTLMLESGGSLQRWFLDPRIKALAAYTVSGDADYPTLHTKARALGGNSNFWTGRCERYHPSDFERHAYTPGDNPWPVAYGDMEPLYERAERTLRVRGGEPSSHAAPRRHAFPRRTRKDLSGLRALLGHAGVDVDDSPTATPEHALRFFRLHKELLPGVLASPYVTLVSGLTATRLVRDGEDRVSSVEVRSLDGTTRQARARIFVVACGGIETPRLLLLSADERAAAGIGNAHGRVGRGFNEHPGVNFYAKLRHSRETLHLRHNLGRSHQFYDELRPEGLGSVLPVFIQSWAFPNHLIQPKLSDLPGTLAAFASRITRPSLYIGATIEMLPRDTNRVTLSQDHRDRFGNPIAHLSLDFADEDRRTLERTRKLIQGVFERLGADDLEEGELTWSRHHIGTCRMGADPKTSVADPTLRVHDTHNLYLSGSETFVTGAAVPPVLTIVALAHRLGDELVRRLQEEAS